MITDAIITGSVFSHNILVHLSGTICPFTTLYVPCGRVEICLQNEKIECAWFLTAYGTYALIDKASGLINDNELLSLFHSVEQLSSEDKSYIKTMIDSLVTKRHLQQLAQ